MADATHIEWTDATWNPITGCSVVSPGCTNCYAMKLAGTRLQHHPSRKGLTAPSKAGPVWTGEVRFNAEWLDQPLRWQRPRRIFVCAHGDLFHESVPDAWIDQVFAVMALAPQHTFQVLTKRAARMRAYLTAPDLGLRLTRTLFDRCGMHPETLRMVEAGEAPGLFGGDGQFRPLPNVWLGVSAEDQPRADERIGDLIFTPAAVRFVSLEPMIGSIDLGRIKAPKVTPEDEVDDWYFDALTPGEYYFYDCGEGLTEGGDGPDRPALDWVIVGGESASDARPMHPDWVRELRDQCAAADVAFFFKQWGCWTPGENVTRRTGKVTGATRDFGRWFYADEYLADTDGHADDEPDLYNVGKKAAGRLLDGIEHNAMPPPGRVGSADPAGSATAAEAKATPLRLPPEGGAA